MSELETDKIVCADSLEYLQTLPENSIHACVTDPPYGLNFMPDVTNGWDDFEPKEYQEWCEKWATEVLRVLKPGGHLLAFSGNRTHHRMFTGVEDAGFEIRDTITWHYGSGFPKAADMSKMIDRRSGDSGPELASILRKARNEADLSRSELADKVGCTESSIRDWEEGRRRSKDDNGVEWVIPSDQYRDTLSDVLPAYPSAAERDIIGYYKEHSDRDGVFDSEQTGFGSGEKTATETRTAKKWNGWKTGLKPSTEYVVMARKPFDGATVDCVLEHGTGALNIDVCRIDTDENLNGGAYTGEGESDKYGDGLNTRGEAGEFEQPEGRYPSNVVFDAVEANRLDEQVGELEGPWGANSDSVNEDSSMFGISGGCENERWAEESGGPSRYFYTSKASKAERTLDGQISNAHPTVKPQDLMEWLVKLVTRENQIVLDPFTGSGTTLKACKELNREFVGIEKQAKWADVARVRVGLTPNDPSVVRDDDSNQQGLESYTD